MSDWQNIETLEETHQLGDRTIKIKMIDGREMRAVVLFYHHFMGVEVTVIGEEPTTVTIDSMNDKLNIAEWREL